MFEIVAGELHAKLGVGSGMWEVTAGCESCGMEGPGRGAGGRQRGLAGQHTDTATDWRPPRGLRGLAGLRGGAPNEVRSPSLAGGRGLRRPEHQRHHKPRPIGGRREACGAWPDNESTRRATHQRPGATGVEGAGGSGGPGCGARGRWRGLAGLRADAFSHTSATQAPPVWRAPEGPEGTGGLRGAAPNEVRTPSLAGGRALRRPEHQRGRKHRHRKRKAYSPRNALIAGISRTACTRPAR